MEFLDPKTGEIITEYRPNTYRVLGRKGDKIILGEGCQEPVPEKPKSIPCYRIEVGDEHVSNIQTSPLRCDVTIPRIGGGNPVVLRSMLPLYDPELRTIIAINVEDGLNVILDIESPMLLSYFRFSGDKGPNILRKGEDQDNPIIREAIKRTKIDTRRAS